MSDIANLPSGTPPGDETSARPWQPGLTRKDAARQGVDQRTYRTLFVWARSVVEHHQHAGTARDQWEGTTTHNEQFVGPYVQDAEASLAARLDNEADPLLDSIHDAAETARAALDAAQDHPFHLTTPESGTTYSGADAVRVVRRADARIETDVRAGRHHHRRVARWVVLVSRALPWVEALGLLGFVTYFLDVPLLQPWLDPLAFSLAVTLVSVVIYGQTRLVHQAGEMHNIAREAATDRNRTEAEHAYRRRNRLLALAATAALAITGGMILRGTAALGDAQLQVTLLLVALAVLAGLLMPLVTYLSVAMDGSAVSRERDSLAAGLDADRNAHRGLVKECQGSLALMADLDSTLLRKTLPAICAGVQEIVDGVYSPYNTARLLIGGLTADPPQRRTRSIRVDTDGRLHGEIGTGIRGARAVDLTPLFDRVARLAALEGERTALVERLDGLPTHPWDFGREP